MKKLDGKRPKLVLVISSILRRRLDADTLDDEIHEIQNIVGVDVALAGFSSYGEFCSETRFSSLDSVNNGSLMLWAICE